MMRLFFVLVVSASADAQMNSDTRKTLQKLGLRMFQEKSDEEAAFADFSRENQNAQNEATTTMEISTKKIADAQDSIDSFQSKEDGLDARMLDLQASVETSRREVQDCKNEQQSAARILAEDKAEFNAKEEDAKVAHGAVLEAQEQIAGLLQVSPMNKFAHKTAATLIQMFAPSDEQKGIDNNYAAQTGGVMDQLKSLEKKFLNQMQNAAAQRKEAEHQESVLNSECNAVIENQNNRINNLLAKKQAATAGKSKAASQKASYQKHKADQTKVHERAAASLAELRANLAEESKKHQTSMSQKQEGLSILCDNIYPNNEADRTNCLEQGPTSAVEFLQIEAKVAGIDAVSNMLMDGSKKLQQPMLAQLAVEMSVAVGRANPMKKIEDMIFNMINKLKDESLKERTMEDQCDSQIKINKQERATRKQEMNTQFAEMKEQQAQSQKLSNQMADTKDTLDDMAFKRKQEKDSFDSLDRKRNALIASYETCVETLDSVEEIINSGGSNQNKADFGSIKKQLGDNIEDLQAARTVSREEEDAAIKNYKDETNDLNTQNEQDTAAKADADSAANDAQSRHATEKKAFEAAQEEEARLKAQCTDREESFEERVARRENTIAMLKDANQMLKARNTL